LSCSAYPRGRGHAGADDLLSAAGCVHGALAGTRLAAGDRRRRRHLYHFFPGKQDLLLAVLEAYLGGIDAMLLAPSWKGVDDPIERVFALLARYRLGIVQTECVYACPIGSLALEIHEPDPPVRKALAANFKAWTDAIEACLVAAGARLPKSLDRRELSRFVLTTMEGGVMQARTHRDVAYFDSSVRQLRTYFDLLEREAASGKPPSAKPPRKRPPSRWEK
jgi:AcrR family transcriptional regulator